MLILINYLKCLVKIKTSLFNQVFCLKETTIRQYNLIGMSKGRSVEVKINRANSATFNLCFPFQKLF